MDADKVIDFLDASHKIQAKVVREKYKKHNITITFLVESKKWKWEVEYVSVTTYGDIADTIAKAKRAAEKHIDRTLKIKGQDDG